MFFVLFVGVTTSELAAAPTSGSAAAAAAAATTVLSNASIKHRELVRFHDFLIQHPDTAAALSASPFAVKDRGFLATHDDLNQYLQTNRAFARKLRAHPKAVLNQAGKVRR